MPQESLTAKLVKANANTKKLCEFFVARRDWTFPPGGEPSPRDLGQAAIGVGEELRTLIARCGANPIAPREPDVPSLGEGTHDPARLQRFIVFLRELGIWFSAQSNPPTDSDGIAALREMDGHVGYLAEFFAKALKTHRETNAPEPPPEKAIEVAAEPPLDVDDEIAPFQQQLVLEDSEARPLVHEFQGRQELTPECEKLADRFLASWEVELSYYNRKKLLEKILRWITSAPEGQVLVIKMRTIEEPHTPYPSYVSREVLSGGAPPTSP